MFRALVQEMAEVRAVCEGLRISTPFSEDERGGGGVGDGQRVDSRGPHADSLSVRALVTDTETREDYEPDYEGD